jgi:hypothetical protein
MSNYLLLSGTIQSDQSLRSGRVRRWLPWIAVTGLILVIGTGYLKVRQSGLPSGAPNSVMERAAH